MSTHYVEMNRTLRERDRNSLADVGDAIALADRGLEKLPSYQGWVHRGVESSSPVELAARYVPGQMVTEDGFTSTSSADGAQYKGTVQFRIKSDSGKMVESFSRYEKEKEVLFRPGSRFMVVDKERDGDVIVITMEEVAGGGGPGVAGPGPSGGVPETTDRHESPTLGGMLAWDNKARFQHAYAEVMRQNPSMDPQAAADLAILQTPYGSARDGAGYDVKMTASGTTQIVTGDPPRVVNVPENVSAVARKR